MTAELASMADMAELVREFDRDLTQDRIAKIEQNLKYYKLGLILGSEFIEVTLRIINGNA